MWKHIWRARDRQLARQVRTIAKTMRAESETPVRITAVVVMRRLGKSRSLSQYMDKLPRMTRALDRVIESPLAFRLRCLRLVAAHSFQAKQGFTRAQLLRAAKARAYKDDPMVARVVTELCARNSRLTRS